MVWDPRAGGGRLSEKMVSLPSSPPAFAAWEDLPTLQVPSGGAHGSR